MSVEDIYDMAFNGDVTGLGRLLREDPKWVHHKNCDDDTLLHFACWGKQIGVIGTLLAFSPDVNARGCYGRTPLHYAVHEGRQISVPIVSSLLAHGANPDIKDNNGYPPDDWARIEMVDGLVEVLELIAMARQQGGTS
jgi:hypothetical protein